MTQFKWPHESVLVNNCLDWQPHFAPEGSCEMVAGQLLGGSVVSSLIGIVFAGIGVGGNFQ